MTPTTELARFGLIIVGDEILSGKRQDKHLARVIEILAARGLQLSWAHYLGDDRARIAETLRRTFASDDVVFCCGGIGSTADDHTRQAAAMALDLDLVLHPEAAALIAQRCADMAAEGRGRADMTLPENRQRLKMGEFPAGSRIIPNPFNRIAGFACARHWFVPGFPVMAWPMIEWVLDQHYRALFHRVALSERSVLVFETAESLIAPLMEQVEAAFPGIKSFSLPSVGDGADGRPRRRHIELGVKGPVGQVDEAFDLLQSGLHELGCEVEVTIS
jgi:molybdopterin-biosynthesis enzyme MoeA-like protein